MSKTFGLATLGSIFVATILIIAGYLTQQAFIHQSKIKLIYQDYAKIKQGFDEFTKLYKCIPGDCSSDQVSVEIFKNTPSYCFDSQKNTINTKEISDAKKRTCAFYQLQNLSANPFGDYKLSKTPAAKFFNTDFESAKNTILSNKIAINNILGNKDIYSVSSNPVQGTIVLFDFSDGSFDNAQKIIDSGCQVIQEQLKKCANTYNPKFVDRAKYASISKFSCNEDGYITPETQRALNFCQCGNQNGCNNGTCGTKNQTTSEFLCVSDIYQKIYRDIVTPAINIKTANTKIADFESQISYASFAIAGSTVPVILKEENGVWDLRTIGYQGAPVNGYYPYEITFPSNQAIFDNLQKKTALILRTSTTTSDLLTDENLSALASNISFMLDKKYDDGKPYQGNIIAGKNFSDVSNNKACTNIQGASWGNIGESSKALDYAKTNNKQIGCIISFII